MRAREGLETRRRNGDTAQHRLHGELEVLKRFGRMREDCSSCRIIEKIFAVESSVVFRGEIISRRHAELLDSTALTRCRAVRSNLDKVYDQGVARQGAFDIDR